MAHIDYATANKEAVKDDRPVRPSALVASFLSRQSVMPSSTRDHVGERVAPAPPLQRHWRQQHGVDAATRLKGRLATIEAAVAPAAVEGRIIAAATSHRRDPGSTDLALSPLHRRPVVLTGQSKKCHPLTRAFAAGGAPHAPLPPGPRRAGDAGTATWLHSRAAESQLTDPDFALARLEGRFVREACQATLHKDGLTVREWCEMLRLNAALVQQWLGDANAHVPSFDLVARQYVAASAHLAEHFFVVALTEAHAQASEHRRTHRAASQSSSNDRSPTVKRSTSGGSNELNVSRLTSSNVGASSVCGIDQLGLSDLVAPPSWVMCIIDAVKDMQVATAPGGGNSIDGGKVLAWVSSVGTSGDRETPASHFSDGAAESAVELTPKTRAAVWRYVIRHRAAVISFEDKARRDALSHIRRFDNEALLRTDILRATRSLLPAVDLLRAAGEGTAAGMVQATGISAVSSTASPTAPHHRWLRGAPPVLGHGSPLTLGRRRIVPPLRDDFVTETVISAQRFHDFDDANLGRGGGTGPQQQPNQSPTGESEKGVGRQGIPPLSLAALSMASSDGDLADDAALSELGANAYLLRQPSRSLLNLLRNHPLPETEQRRLQIRLLQHERHMAAL